jgi:transposase
MLDSTIEIVTGRERRRRWSIADKLRIVAETQEPGSRIGEVAVRHDIAASLLHGWRHQARHGRLSADGMAGFVPVRLLQSQRAACSHPATAAPIEIALPDGSRLYIRNGARAATLRDVIVALRP